MVDEIDTTKEGDAIVSNDEIDAVTKKVLAEGKKEKDKMEVDVEAKIRAKIEAENHLKELEKQNQQYKESIQRQEEEKQRIAADKDKEIEELKTQVGGSKAVHNTQSPFSKSDKPEEVTKEVSAIKNLTREQISEINENSKHEFMKVHGIKDSQWE